VCLAIPMKIIEIKGNDAIVAAGGLRKKADMSLVTGAKTGDYVLVHAGFAIEKVKTSEAKKTLNALRDIDEVYR
jgi:hydrogenase expression/formation protein HypC